MAGPGSRVEKFGTIFTRVTGLLRSGALKPENKPLWYEVYAAFPPKPPPQVVSETTSKPTKDIFYLEDLVRAKFYRVYGNPEPIDMREERSTTVSQRFVDKYFELSNQGVGRGEVFKAATEALLSDGIKLKSVADIAKEKEEAAARRAEMQALIEKTDSQTPGDLAASVLTNSPARLANAEDTMEEDVPEPDK